MTPGITEEVSKQVGGFMEIMKLQPLSLALVVMNLLLIVFLFYSNSQVLTQRKDALDRIVEWQSATDKLMASCVSAEIMKMVLEAIGRDRGLQHPPLPAPKPDDPKPQSIEYLPPFSMPP